MVGVVSRPVSLAIGCRNADYSHPTCCSTPSPRSIGRDMPSFQRGPMPAAKMSVHPRVQGMWCPAPSQYNPACHCDGACEAVLGGRPCLVARAGYRGVLLYLFLLSMLESWIKDSRPSSINFFYGNVLGESLSLSPLPAVCSSVHW